MGKGYLKSRSLDSPIRYPAKGYLKKGYLKIQVAFALQTSAAV